MRRAAKVDETHKAIVDALREAGCSVSSTPVGDGFPDMVCAYRGYTALVEAKTGKKGLNEQQRAFHLDWQGKIVIANSPEMAVNEFFKAWSLSRLGKV